MRKHLFLFMLGVVCSMGAFAQFSGSGNGTVTDPYLIFNETQLSQVKNFLNQENVYFKLMKDLNISSWINENNPSQGWVAIGIESTPFKGHFDGNNHAISGVYINRASTAYIGFFGYVSRATIENLTLNGTTITGANYVGALAGYMENTTVSGCNANMTLVKSLASDAGGLVGKASETSFSTCTYTGNVHAAELAAGGVVGWAAGGVTFSDCVVTGDSYAAGRSGGIVGAVDLEGSIVRCTVKGTMTGTHEVGGIAGSLLSGSSCTFTSNYHEGEITNTGDYTGGIVGASNGSCISAMSDCSHFGKIAGQSFVGGLVGAILGEDVPVYYLSDSRDRNNKNAGPFPPASYEENGTLMSKSINNCVVIGNVNGANHVGGLIGKDAGGHTYEFIRDGRNNQSGYKGFRYIWRNNQYIGDFYGNTYCAPVDRINGGIDISNCYYSGIIRGSENVGGLIGNKEAGSVTNCYSYATLVEGGTNVGGLIGLMKGIDGHTITLQSNASINTTISATTANVGRIYGAKGNNYCTIGAMGSSQGNRALTQTKVLLCGVLQEVTDDFQNGSSMGPTELKLKATYVASGWDFENDWTMLETECFPYKRYQAAPPVIESNLVSQATSITGKSVNGGRVTLYYKDNAPVICESVNHQWTFATEPLQSGAAVQLYTYTEGMTPSYFSITTVGYPGSGTKNDPYRVYTAADLQGVYKTGYYKMMNDIDLTEWIAENNPTGGWVSIGRNSGEATYFDGDGHTVTGLWVESTDDYTGLFSNYSTGEISNLTVRIAEGKKVKGGDYTGGLIGRNANGKIENCAVYGDVEGTLHVGGIAGIVENNQQTNLTYEGTVSTTSDAAYAGGLVGYSPSTLGTSSFSRCEATATVNATGSTSRVGGFAGALYGGTLEKCHATATLTASGEGSFVGGLVGWSSFSISSSYSTGAITASGENSYTGGLVGWSEGPISNSYSMVTTTGTQYTGGLVGYAKQSSIDKCFARGDVYGVLYGGGLVAELEGAGATATNSVAANNVIRLSAQSSWGSRVIGGFRDGAPTPDESNYALNTMQVSLNNKPQTKTDDIVEGIAKTEAELQTAATYTGLGWNLTDIWGIEEGSIYPYLLWEVSVSLVESITLDKTSLVIANGNTATLTATISPKNATNRILAWSSSNESVVTVDNGVLTTVAEGTAVITVSATDASGVTATCEVTVCKNEAEAIAALQTLVDEAQALYDNSTEGTNVGDYEAGARAELLSAINAVRAQMSSTMSSAEIASCTSAINTAVETFESKRVKDTPDTDISGYNHILYATAMEVAPGSQATLSISMKNTTEIASFQFDLALPEGVDVVYNVADDEYAIDLNTERTTLKRHSIAVNKQTDGTYRVVCSSSKNYGFNGNDGEVLTVLLDVDDNLADGNYPILINAQEMATASMEKHNVDQCKSTLTILSYTLGDVNGDKSVSVVDVNGVVNLILGTNTDGLVTKAADVNNDGSISVVDANGVVNIILYGNPYGSNASPAPMRRGNGTPAVTSGDENTLVIEAINAAPGSQVVVPVLMNNANDIASFQADLYLPEGMTVAKDAYGDYLVDISTERTTAKKHSITASEQSDGAIRIVCTTMSNASFSGTSGEVATITFDISGTMAQGEYTLSLRNMELATAAMVKYNPTDANTSVSIASSGPIVLDEASTSVPEATSGAVELLVKRTIKANSWSTICLPFDMTGEQVKAAFGNDVQLAELESYDWDDVENSITVNFTDVNIDADGFFANYPYLIKVSSNITEFNITAKVDPDEANAVAEYAEGRGTKRHVYGTFYGTLHAGGFVPANNLFLSDNKFYYSTGISTIKAFRGYLELEDVISSASSCIEIRINDGATRVEELNMESKGGMVYDLSGRKMLSDKNLERGVYIVDGRKIIVK